MKLIVLTFVGWVSVCALAATEKKDVTFGGFVDSYYGFDFNEPTGDRTFTTTGARHNEFSINLAFVDVRLDREKVRGRLALQTGNSVYANYSGERTVNPALGDLMQHLQEAYGGYRLAEVLWLDVGIFFSHIGAESFISKDNWNYTRSLGADYSPYYQAGVRLNYQWNPKWSSSLQVMNGWQNTIETNSDKALGMQVTYAPSEDVSVTYNNFIGRETEFRFFNNFILKTKLSPALSLSLSSDLGFQKKVGTGDFSIWYVETLLTQLRLSETLTLGGRLEYFHDKDQVVVRTSTPEGFQTFGASLNLDWQPESYLMLRNEIRGLFSKDSVFAGKSGPKNSNALFVTSLSLMF